MQPHTAGPAAQRVASVANLRDLGGLPTASGRRIAHGRLFRSSHLAALTAADARVLGLRTVVDFRGVDERAAAPSANLGDDTEHLHLPMEPRALSKLRALASAEHADPRAISDMMVGIYRRFVRDQAAVYRALLQRLQVAGACPLLFHCTAGKDRTGFAAAVVLLALDVPQHEIERDFLASNAHWRPADRKGGWVTLSEVRSEYLHAAFETMRDSFGSVDGFLREALGIDDAARARLADNLLEPGPR